MVVSPLADPEPCDVPECFAPACEAEGFMDPEAICFGGVCRFREVSCDPDLVLCDAEPPSCSEGWLPRVSPAGCWDGCVPVSACDTVPDCSHCRAGEVCVVTTDLTGTHRDCEPLPAGCSADDPCGCTPAFCPEGRQCQVPADGQVECTCPDCDGP